MIARNSSFTYKGRAVNIKQVGRELGVRYLLEGSVRRAGGRVRITGQLIEAATGGHVWADRFEGAFDDVFELQDRITDSVVGAIEPSLRRAETVRAWAKPTDNLDAYDLYLRGAHQIYVATHESLDAAIRFLRGAVANDPHYELAKGYLALAYAIRDAHGWDAPGDREAAIALARGAIAAADDNPTTLRAAGDALAYFAVEMAGVSGGELRCGVGRTQPRTSIAPEFGPGAPQPRFRPHVVGRHRTGYRLFRSSYQGQPTGPGDGVYASWSGNDLSDLRQKRGRP